MPSRIPEQPKEPEENQNPMDTISKSLLEGEIIEALRKIYDPEIPVNIYDLGLIYDITIKEDGFVHVLMTLTTPHCPVAEILPKEVEAAVRGVKGVKDVYVELTWDPPFTIDRMSEEAKMLLGLW
ncbi:MAG TPA: SUF system Fe-S cluster assembly protein [Fimbriimonadales bacterium]|nr:SUF system Fe-S cluster assembly protein [Fimbriimonadales bacterium]